MNKNFIFVFGCFEAETPHGVQTDFAKVEIYASNEKDALKKIKGLLKKKKYELIAIMQICEPSKDRPRYVINVQRYDKYVNDGDLVNNMNVEVWADSVEEAIKMAEKLIDRKFSRISKIVEKLPEEK